jgi:hypothetical protein
MRIVLLNLILLLAGLSCISCRSTQDTESRNVVAYLQEPSSPEEGYTNLISNQLFAPGGIGIGCTPSPGELALRAILKSTNAPDIFKAVLQSGTGEGKLYALCGIRVTDRNEYTNYADAVGKTYTKVTTGSGCLIGFHENIADVVKRISDGNYDSYLQRDLAKP